MDGQMVVMMRDRVDGGRQDRNPLAGARATLPIARDFFEELIFDSRELGAKNLCEFWDPNIDGLEDPTVLIAFLKAQSEGRKRKHKG